MYRIPTVSRSHFQLWVRRTQRKGLVLSRAPKGVIGDLGLRKFHTGEMLRPSLWSRTAKGWLLCL